MLAPRYPLLTSKLLAIVGPTASGKSDLGMKLAEELGGEIIAADSRTVYRYMDIGTAKPSQDDMLRISHHLVNVVDPDQRYSAAEFKEAAVKVIDDISRRGRLPIMVGGTGLYIDSVLYDYRFPVARRGEQAEGTDEDLPELVGRLKEVDPETAERIDLNNPRRVQRALETLGAPRSKSPKLRPDTLVLGMAMDKKVIQKRIEQRAEKMLRQGLIQEVKFVDEKFGWEHEALRAPAYASFKDVVSGQKPVEEGTAEFVRRDMALVKKQITWFKRNHDITWLDAHDPAAATAQAKELVTEFMRT